MRHDTGGVYDGLSISDMQTYGAEDMEELVSILDALEGADRSLLEPAPDVAWKDLLAAPRHQLGKIEGADVPTSPGVCVVFDEGQPVFVSRGAGKEGLRGRIRTHRATDADLSRSTLRASVAVDLLGISRWTARQRPGVISEKFLDSVNEYLAACDVAWVECADADAARELKRRLLAEYVPEYNLKG